MICSHNLDVGDFNPRDLDAIILSHAHLDHSGLVPFLFKYGYQGPIYTSEPTSHLATMLQLDYINICKREGKPSPYSKKDITKCPCCILIRWNGER